MKSTTTALIAIAASLTLPAHAQTASCPDFDKLIETALAATAQVSRAVITYRPADGPLASRSSSLTFTFQQPQIAGQVCQFSVIYSKLGKYETTCAVSMPNKAAGQRIRDFQDSCLVKAGFKEDFLGPYNKPGAQGYVKLYESGDEFIMDIVVRGPEQNISR